MCAVNKQMELLEFVYDSDYVDLQYDEISLTFIAGSVCLCGLCRHVVSYCSDPFPTRLLMPHIHAIVPILQHIVNLCLTMGDFPISCKSSMVIPLIKKPGLDREMLKNYRPVSNRSFLSKVIEEVISIRILGHILDNNIVDSFQSAYRAGHFVCTMILSQLLEKAMDHF